DATVTGVQTCALPISDTDGNSDADTDRHANADTNRYADPNSESEFSRRAALLQLLLSYRCRGKFWRTIHWRRLENGQGHVLWREIGRASCRERVLMWV